MPEQQEIGLDVSSNQKRVSDLQPSLEVTHPMGSMECRSSCKIGQQCIVGNGRRDERRTRRALIQQLNELEKHFEYTSTLSDLFLGEKRRLSSLVYCDLSHFNLCLLALFIFLWKIIAWLMYFLSYVWALVTVQRQ